MADILAGISSNGINDENKNEYDLSDPIVVDDTTHTGTIVTITGVNGLLREDLDFVELEDAFLRTFAWYLYLNRNKKKSLLLNGEVIDFEKYIDPDAKKAIFHICPPTVHK